MKQMSPGTKHIILVHMNVKLAVQLNVYFLQVRKQF